MDRYIETGIMCVYIYILTEDSYLIQKTYMQQSKIHGRWVWKQVKTKLKIYIWKYSKLFKKKKEKTARILIHQQKVITSNRTENNIIINITIKDVSHCKTYALDHVYIYIYIYIYIQRLQTCNITRVIND